MDTHDSSPNAALRLKRLLKAAGLRSYPLDATGRIINFLGRTREWSLVARLTPDWLNMYTLMCELPSEPGIRARLLELTMEANRTLSLAKFGIFGTSLGLEIDYRAEHIDQTVLGNLIGLLNAHADEHYPKVFRIVSGEDVLESLERKLEAGAAS